MAKSFDKKTNFNLLKKKKKAAGRQKNTIAVKSFHLNQQLKIIS